MASLSRSLAAVGLLCAGVFGGREAQADASMAWVAAASGGPVEQRVAVAVGPTRSTVWLSLRAGGAGPLGVVVALPPGASLDRSSDAWLEALDLATAPRVLAPADQASSCDPGAPGAGYVVEGRTTHLASSVPTDQAILATAAEVVGWMNARGADVDPSLEQALSESAGARFFVSFYPASSAERLTPTWRLVVPTVADAPPLSLVRAGASDLVVTAWSLGEGRATLGGLEERRVDPAALIYNPADQTTNYATLRHDALVGAGAAWLESSSHEALGANVPILDGRATIDGVVESYFDRAIAYGDGAGDAVTCTQIAAAALGLTSPVATACPRNESGPADAASCVEAPVSGQIDPARLRCGGADDLAIALSELTPAGTWLTRHTMVLAAGQAAPAPSVAFAAGLAVPPVLEAAAVDVAACGGTGSGQGGGSATGGGGGSGGQGGASGASGVGGSVGAVVGGGPGPIPGQPGWPVDPGGGYDDYNDGYVDTAVGCACSGTETGYDPYYDDTSSDDCSSDTSDSYYDGSADDCASDTSSTSSDDCASDTSSADDCAGDTSSADCSVRSGKRRRPVPLSAMTLLGIVALVPLRRRLRPRR